MDERQVTKVVLFSLDEKTVEYLQRFSMQHANIGCQVDLCTPKISAEEIILRYNPVVILCDFGSFDPPTQDILLSKLERISEKIPIVGIFQEDQKDDIVNFIKRGVRDVLFHTLKDYEVIKIFERFKRDTQSTSTLKKTGRVFSFFSLKGGVGNSFITLNTAISLARLSKKKVLLWDMALQAGDIPFFLNHEPQYSLIDILENLDQVDETFLEGVLPIHESGVALLPAPVKMEELERLSSDILEKVLRIFVSHFDYIFIDCGYRLTDVVVPLVDASHYLFITTTLELISLRSASRCLDLFEKLNYSPEKLKIVINRYNSKHDAITVKKAKEIFKYEMVQFIPNDYVTASRSVNFGQAVIDVAKGTDLDKKFQEFAQKVRNDFDEDALKQKKAGGLKGLFGMGKKKKKKIKAA